MSLMSEGLIWIPQVVACLGPPDIICEANGVVFCFIGPIDFTTQFINILWWFEAVNPPRQSWYHNSFSDCPLVAFLSCWIVLSGVLMFLRNISIASCFVLVFCRRTLSFKFWTIKVEKFEQTIVLHVSIDVTKNAFFLIIWVSWK